MAQRRMFSKIITNSSQFLMMPQSAQNLYFHFGMNADDDGFCEHFTIMRMTESKPDDLRILQAKGFIKIFDDKVLVIIDWKENNYIQKDRYTPSKYLEIYKEEIKQLSSCIQDVSKVDTQVRLGKVRKGKVRERESVPTNLNFKFLNELKDIERISILEEKFKRKLSRAEKDEIKNFISYWTETNHSGMKQRWQLEKTFDYGRRIGTWFRNMDSFGNNKDKPLIIE